MGLRALIEWVTKEQTRKVILEHKRPVCPECGEPYSLEYFPRPSGRPGNRYVPTCDCDLKNGGS